jgi:hypothetical protein
MKNYKASKSVVDRPKLEEFPGIQNPSFGFLMRTNLEVYNIGHSELWIGRVWRCTKSVVRRPD